MSERFHTVEDAAARLQVHPKTVLRFIRDGRLRATRIGKAWRIRAADLDAFAGGPAEALPARSSALVTAIADLQDVSAETAQRLATAMQALAMTPSERAQPMRLDTAYDPGRRHLKVIVIAGALDAATVLQTLHAFTEAFR